MNEKIRLCTLAPWHPTGNHDVFVGFTKAFRLLGYHTDAILGHVTYRDWCEFYKISGITSGLPAYNFTQEDIVKSASLNCVIKSMGFSPDVMVIIDGTSIHKDAWMWWRRLGIPTFVISTECPYQDNFVTHAAEIATYTFVNELITHERTGLEYLPMGYDSEAHHPMIVGSSFRHDVVFVGSGFPERVKVMSAVDWEGIDLQFYGQYNIPDDSKLAPYYTSAMIPNAQTAILYNGAKICLNLNRTSIDKVGSARIVESKSLSPRAYEIAACGGFMISEYRYEIHNTFGDLVPTFTDPRELNELIHYWLPRDKERREIGDELAKIAKKHSYINRAKIVMKRIRELL